MTGTSFAEISFHFDIHQPLFWQLAGLSGPTKSTRFAIAFRHYKHLKHQLFKVNVYSVD